MVDIVRREQQEPIAREGRDPFERMRELMHWEPWREMRRWWGEGHGWEFVPAFDVKETKEAIVFRADLPGIRESDLDITVSGNRLIISGKREEERHEQGETWYCSERTAGNFTRTFTLPEGVDLDAVQAELHDGVLTMRVPKRPDAQPRRVEIGAGKAGGVKA